MGGYSRNRCRGRTCTWASVLALGLLYLAYVRYKAVGRRVQTSSEEVLDNVHADKRPAHTILVWTNIFGVPVNENIFSECDLRDNCVLTADRSLLGEASAVIFHVSTGDFAVADLPRIRLPSQRFVFLTMEVPVNNDRALIHSVSRNFFNWTMTYRRDSDIPMPYGGWWVNPSETKLQGFTPESLPFDGKTILAHKNGTVFWLVSHCSTQSKRELAVEKLSKYIDVDIYGSCATGPTKRPCPHGAECERSLAEENYFYLALENTVCKDYITEKYWNRYPLPSVPIIMRRRTYEKLLPPKSFIAMDDFESAKQMADYLHLLMRNSTEYMKYFAWRADGWSRPWQRNGYRQGYCKVCERLLEDFEEMSVSNLERWFYETSECESDEFASGWKSE